jgi:hypothetical protein
MVSTSRLSKDYDIEMIHPDSFAADFVCHSDSPTGLQTGCNTEIADLLRNRPRAATYSGLNHLKSGVWGMSTV